MGQRTGPSSANPSRTDIEPSHEAPADILTGTRLINGEALFADPRTAAIVVIEQRLLIRDCLVKCLRDLDLGCPVLAFSSISEWLETAAQYVPILILYSLQPQNADNSEIDQNLSLLNGNKAGDVPLFVELSGTSVAG